MKKVLIYLLFFFFISSLVSAIDISDKLEIYFFWGQGCPHCAKEKPFLEKLKGKYPQLEIKDFEVYYNKENQELFNKIAKAYNTSALGVPMTFIGKNFIIGFGSEETTGQEIEKLIQECLKTKCPSPEEILLVGGIEKINSTTNTTFPPIRGTKIPPEANFPPILLGTKPPVTSSLCIHYFIKDNCPQCENLAQFLEKIASKYKIDLVFYNVSEKENLELFQKLQEYYGVSLGGFPMVFLGNSYLVGDEAIKDNIEKIIQRCLKENCPCPVEEISQTYKIIPKPSTFLPEEKEKISFEFFGKKIILSSKSSLVFLGSILGLADGINPCMFSVLLFLLTYLLAVGSKKKAIKTGLVFTVGVFIIYLLFMVGIINLITLIGVIQKIKLIVAILALIFGIIMIKDFFYYGKWFSLEIPKSTKPFIEKLIKKGTLPSALILAFLSSLVELPCTAGIPLVYTTLLVQKSGAYLPYLLWYNFFFIVPLFIIISGVAFTFDRIDKVEKWREKFRKYMRLTAGLILIFLAIALLKGWM